jgi:methyl-galactoside transport system substrate-binding protein
VKRNWKGLLLSSLLAGSLILAAGCGGQSTTAGKDAGKPQIGVAIYKFDDTFMSAVRADMAKAAKGKAILSIVDSQNAQPTQDDKIDLFINKKMKALIINPVDPTAASEIIAKAKKANTPVVFINREPSKADMQKWDKVYYVGARAEQSGTMEGNLLVTYFKAHPPKDGIIHYVMLMGEPGSQDAVLRTKYSVKALTDAGFKVDKLAQDTAMWDRVKGQEKMAAFLAAYGNKIDCVIANNDDMALGAIEALKARGYFKNGKYMPVVGVDATVPGLKALQDGTLYGTVLNDANDQAKAAVNLATVLAEGKTPTEANVGAPITDGKYIWINYKPITKANMNEAKQ